LCERKSVGYAGQVTPEFWSGGHAGPKWVVLWLIGWAERLALDADFISITEHLEIKVKQTWGVSPFAISLPALAALATYHCRCFDTRPGGPPL